MRCPYCRKSVVGVKEVKILAGEGPVHLSCYERSVMSQRIFEGLDLPKLSDDSLFELREMLLSEINSRSASADEIELFC